MIPVGSVETGKRDSTRMDTARNASSAMIPLAVMVLSCGATVARSTHSGIDCNTMGINRMEMVRAMWPVILIHPLLGLMPGKGVL